MEYEKEKTPPLILCDDSQPQKVADLCLKYNTGIELQSFYKYDSLENEILIKDNLSCINNIQTRLLHGPFADLNPGSSDPLIREISLKRYEQAFLLSQKVKSNNIIFHNGYIPNTSWANNWIERASTFWKKFLENKPASLKIYLENHLENDPFILNDLIKNINDERVKINFDIGHCNCFSDKSILFWLEKLNDKITYIHIHDNNGLVDEHLTLGKGSMPILNILKECKTIIPNAIWALELETDGLETSINILKDANLI